MKKSRPEETKIVNTGEKNYREITKKPPISNSCIDLNLKSNVKFTVKYARTLDKPTLTKDELTFPDQIPDYVLKTLKMANYQAREFKIKSSTI